MTPDDPTRPRLRRWRATGYVQLIHPCEVCAAPAGFGYAVKLRGSDSERSLGRWRCGAHRLPVDAMGRVQTPAERAA